MNTASDAWLRRPSSLEVAWENGRRDIKANRRVSLLMLVRHLVQPLIQAGFWLLLARHPRLHSLVSPDTRRRNPGPLHVLAAVHE